jgi:hypothetical protein
LLAVVTKAATNLNGISIAYVMGAVNGLFGLLVAFGVPMSDPQQAAIGGFINGAMILLMHFGHRLGEQAANGSYIVPASLRVHTPPLPPLIQPAAPDQAAS